MNILENNGAIFLKFYGPIFSNCVSLEMLSKYNEIVFSFAKLVALFVLSHGAAEEGANPKVC